MSTPPPLSDTSMAVLALVDATEPTTPYRLKQLAQQSILHFWSIPHTQLYTECSRLTSAGLLDEQREQTGRRRRVYRLTEAGRERLATWRASPEVGPRELRDPSLLKLFCGVDSPAALAEHELPRQQAELAELEALADTDMPQGMRLSLELGIRLQSQYVQFWQDVVGGSCRRRSASGPE